MHHSVMDRRLLIREAGARMIYGVKNMLSFAHGVFYLEMMAGGIPDHPGQTLWHIAHLQADLFLFPCSSDDPIDLGGIGLINSEFGRNHLAIKAVVDI
jgi:hypothetical protein